MRRTSVGPRLDIVLCFLCLAWGPSVARGDKDVNVALNKAYSQISRYHTQGPSRMAANGDTSAFFPDNCIHTREYYSGRGDNNPWWQVDLGRTYPLLRIDVWARHHFKRRLYPSDLTVDGLKCAAITSYPSNSRKKEVTCSDVMYGRKVRITRRGNDQSLNLCEMQIWVPREVSQCGAGRFGTSCHLRCSDHCGKGPGKNFCLQSSGRCYDGCVAGWYGDQCSRHCAKGCQKNGCLQQSGDCLTCDTGYTGHLCTECQDGYYKTKSGTCTRCSSRCQSQSCDSQTGRCHGCVTGRYGDTCSRTCPTRNCRQCHQDTGVCTQCVLNSHLLPPACTDCVDGYFKSSGSLQCSECTWSCQSGTVCDKTTGHCPDCPPGKQGHHCDEDCDSGRYGQNCTGNCGHCMSKRSSDHCDTVTGECPHGCATGWQPPLCQEECEDGQYGDGCAETCGHCLQGAACGKVDGQCPFCDPGWYPPLCVRQCQDGRYGENCTRHCGSCVSGVVCNKSTGHCPCIKGKQPPLCHVDCQNKTYGQNCVETCGQCRGGQPCDPVTGQCSNGCRPGWTDITPSSAPPSTPSSAPSSSPSPLLCQAECPVGYYGDGCNQTCGYCRVTSECRHDTGQCAGQCAEGFTGPYCAEKVKADSSSNIAVIAGAVLSALLVLVIAALVVCFIRRKRRQADKSHPLVTDLSEMSSGTEREGSEHPHSLPLALGPLTNNDDETEARGSVSLKPTASPVVTASPVQNGGNVVYENVSSPPNSSTSEPSTAPPKGDLNVLNAGGPPVRTARTLPSEGGSRLAGKEPKIDEDEPDSMGKAEAIYANDPSLSNFQPATFPLARLQERIVDVLRDGKTDAEFKRMTGLKDYSVTHGMRQENHCKNRFKSILPYDKNRVVLEQVDGDDASDYINASFIKGYQTEKAYIACQGPRSNTQDDFWRMVWQEGVTDIVMLTNVKEGNKRKCHQYWPAKGTLLSTGLMEVTGLEEEERANFVIRTFSVRLSQSDDKRQVRQYHYLKWMDHEVPATTPLVDFWRYVRARAPRTATAPPLVVHCSAGVGRTGTYIALDILMDQTQEEEEVSLFRTVDSLREDRCHMVQNKGQYKFLHEAVVEAYLSGDCRQDTSSFDRLFPHTVHHHLPHPRLDAEFERLCQMRACLPPPSHTVANLEENRHKNRHPEALPDDKHLVYITQHTKGRNQYINAVYMPTFLSFRGSIVTQLPLADTVIDLWRLVDSWDVTTIVSIGQGDGVKDTCIYWPADKDHPVKCGDYTLSLKATTSLGASLTSYTVDINRQDASRDVRVLHYEAWTGEVADNVSDLLHLLDILHTSHKESTQKPIIIQCIDGVAQSGAVCALWNVISRMTYDGEVDVYMAARHVHTVRPEAISSVVQYRFIYQVVQRYIASRTSIYANT